MMNIKEVGFFGEGTNADAGTLFNHYKIKKGVVKMFKLELGVEVKDRITGFKGVIVGRSDYISGCRQYSVKPTELDKNGKMQDGIWFDENRLEIIGKGIDLNKPKEVPGGPALDGHGRNL